jgi:glycogen(starch) synthase
MLGYSVEQASNVTNLLFVAPSYLPFTGGAQSFLQAMARRLVADGHTVTVLTTNARQATDFWAIPHPAEPLAAHETLDGVQVERLPLVYPSPAPYAFGVLRRAGYWLRALRLPAALQRPLLHRLASWMPPVTGLANALERLVPASDIVQVSDSSWDGLLLAVAQAAARHNKPLVLVPFMHLGRQIQGHFQMLHQIEAYRAAEAVVALSQHEAQTYMRLGVSPERVRVLSMGVDPDIPAVGEAEVAAFRREHGLMHPIVAFLGANTYDKGAYTTAQAVARLAREGLPVDLVCAGPQGDSLRNFVRATPSGPLRDALEQRVHILDIVDQATKHRLLAAADLLALPSQVDSFGIVLLEAWLHSKPVIGANVGGIPDLVQPEQNGLLVPFGDAQTLAAAIRRLVEQPAWARALGEVGHQQVMERYTWDHTYRNLLDVYGRARNTRAATAAPPTTSPEEA